MKVQATLTVNGQVIDTLDFENNVAGDFVAGARDAYTKFR